MPDLPYGPTPVLEFDRSWRQFGRAQATDLIVKALRRKALATGGYRSDPQP
jgi:hypothetical protein